MFFGRPLIPHSLHMKRGIPNSQPNLTASIKKVGTFDQAWCSSYGTFTRCSSQGMFTLNLVGLGRSPHCAHRGPRLDRRRCLRGVACRGACIALGRRVVPKVRTLNMFPVELYQKYVGHVSRTIRNAWCVTKPFVIYCARS